MALRQHGLRVGANLVRHLAGAAQRAVAAHDDQVNLPAPHEEAGGVVGDDLVRHALLRQLPRGERRALRARARLVAEDVELAARRLRRIHRRGGGADVHEGQPAGVAMREHPHAVANQLRPVLADGFAMRHVLVGEVLGGGEGEGLLLGDGGAGGHRATHIKHRVDGVHSGGAGLLQHGENFFHIRLKLHQVLAAKRPRALRQPVSRRRADGSRAAHDHVADGDGGGAEVARADDLELVRQQALLDEPDLVLRRLEADGAVVARAPTDGHVHARECAERTGMGKGFWRGDG